MQDDDFSLFKSAIQGVKPIKHDRADTGKPKTDRAQIAKLRQAATVRTDATTVDGLSDQFVIDVGPEDELMWARDGVQESQMRKLKAGQIPFEGSLDLHGMTVEKARETLWAFLAEATKSGFEVDPVLGERMQKIVEKVLATPKDVAVKAKELME